jgi:hypothetical protein
MPFKDIEKRREYLRKWRAAHPEKRYPTYNKEEYKKKDNEAHKNRYYFTKTLPKILPICVYD